MTSGIRETHLSGTSVYSPGEYRRILTDLIGELDRITSETVTAVLTEIANAQAAVRQVLANLPPGSRSRGLYLEALRGIDETLASFASHYRTQLNRAAEAGYDVGVAMAVDPVQHFLPQVSGIAKAAAPWDAVIMASNLPGLIQGVEVETAKRVRNEITAVLLGAKTPSAAAQAVGRTLKTPNHFRTIAHRARAIVVTEVGRTSALGHHNGQLELQRAIAQDPDLDLTVRKRWISAHLPNARQTHIEVEARHRPGADPGPIPPDIPYMVAGIAALYPRDPSLPPAESVNCHCVSVTVIPEIMGDDPIGDTPPPEIRKAAAPKQPARLPPPEPPRPEPGGVLTGEQWAALDPSQRPHTYVRNVAEQFSDERLDLLRATPEGTDLAELVEKWVDSDSMARFRNDMTAVVEGTATDAPRYRRARSLLRAISESPFDKPGSLHRGLRVRRADATVLDQLRVGSTHDWHLSSFSADRAVARSFTRAQVSGAGAATDTAVMIEWVGEGQALPIQTLTGGYMREKEWIAAGRFEVLDVKRAAGAINVTVRMLKSLA